MGSALVWIVIGVVLIISELLATSVIAVFLGIGAIVTGLALALGLIESTASQYTVFGVVSLIMLLVARGKFKQLFNGYIANKGEHGTAFAKDIGVRVKVYEDFDQGAGRVILNGVQWDALSDEMLKQGDVAYVVKNEGIHLTVSSKKPELVAEKKPH